MFAKMEYKGKDVEEAIANACAGLKTTRENLEIRIVSTGATGIFGLGRKKAVIEVSLKEASSQKIGGSKEKKTPAASRKNEAAPVVSAAKSSPDPTPPADDEAQGDPASSEEIETIRQDLLGILQLMGCSPEVSIEVDIKHKLHAHIAGDCVELLTAAEGQALDSLQYLMRKIITRKFPQKILFSLDAGSFRANRREDLTARALQLAAEVKESGKPQTIPAIGPAERRIVHLALQDDPEIRSRSVGDGLFKKVLIYLPGKGGKRPPRRARGGDKGGKSQ